MEIFGAFVGLAVLLQLLAVGLIGLLLPLFWVWMLIDAVLRDDAEYPARSSNEKLVWVLVMVFVQVAAVLYFFMVYRVTKRGSLAGQHVGNPQQSPTPVA